MNQPLRGRPNAAAQSEKKGRRRGKINTRRLQRGGCYFALCRCLPELLRAREYLREMIFLYNAAAAASLISRQILIFNFSGVSLIGS